MIERIKYTRFSGESISFGKFASGSNRKANQSKISDTRGKFGLWKLSIDICSSNPSDRINSVNSKLMYRMK